MLQEFISDVITWGNITNTLQETAMDSVLVELKWTDYFCHVRIHYNYTSNRLLTEMK